MYRVLTGNLGLRRLALVLVEHLVIVLSVVIAATVRLGWPETISEAMTNWVSRAVFAAVVLQLCLHYADLYDSRTLSDRRDLVTPAGPRPRRRFGAAGRPLFLAAGTGHRPRRVRAGDGRSSSRWSRAGASRSSGCPCAAGRRSAC